MLEFDATVQKEIILKGVNKNSAFGVTVATNLDDPTKLDNESELTKFNVFGTAKGHIQDIFFQMKQTKIKKGFRRNGKVEIEDTASLSSAEATALYEATASIALGASSTDVGKLEGYLKQKYILDDGNYDGELIDHFFADIKTISVSGIDYTEWNSTMANWYLETLMGIIKGALLFRKEYATFFNAGVSEILWKDIDKTFKNKWFTKIGSGRVGHKTKENTADALVFISGGTMTWGHLYALKSDDLKKISMVEKKGADDGVVEILFNGKVVAEILQISMKASRSGAQGGKSLTALAGHELYDVSRRGSIETYLWIGPEISTQEESYQKLDELFNLGKLKGFITKGISFLTDLLSKTIKKIKGFIWGAINKITSKSTMKRSLVNLHSELNKGVLGEGLKGFQTDWDKTYREDDEKVELWEQWKDRTKEVFLKVAGELDKAVGESPYFVQTGFSAKESASSITNTFSRKEYNQVAMLNIPVNIISFEVMRDVARKLADSEEGFKQALLIFNSLSFDMSMGDSNVPVIKLYGVEWSVKEPSANGNFEFDVIKRVDTSGKEADSIKKIATIPEDDNDENYQPMGGFSMRPSARDKGHNYLATYMYIFYEYKEVKLEGEKTPKPRFTYKKMQIRPDKGGIAAESYPQTYIWDADTKTFKKK